MAVAEEKGWKEGSTAPKGSLIYLHEAALSLSQLWSQCARGRGRGLGTSLLHLHSLSLSLSLCLISELIITTTAVAVAMMRRTVDTDTNSAGRKIGVCTCA